MKYEVRFIERCVKVYVVEAPSADEAELLFQDGETPALDSEYYLDTEGPFVFDAKIALESL